MVDRARLRTISIVALSAVVVGALGGAWILRPHERAALVVSPESELLDLPVPPEQLRWYAQSSSCLSDRLKRLHGAGVPILWGDLATMQADCPLDLAALRTMQSGALDSVR